MKRVIKLIYVLTFIVLIFLVVFYYYETQVNIKNAKNQVESWVNTRYGNNYVITDYEHNTWWNSQNGHVESFIDCYVFDYALDEENNKDVIFRVIIWPDGTITDTYKEDVMLNIMERLKNDHEQSFKKDAKEIRDYLDLDDTFISIYFGDIYDDYDSLSKILTPNMKYDRKTIEKFNSNVGLYIRGNTKKEFIENINIVMTFIEQSNYQFHKAYLYVYYHDQRYECEVKVGKMPRELIFEGREGYSFSVKTK